MRPTSEEIDELIVKTREAHEVLRDIKVATKELQDTIKKAKAAEEALVATVVEAVDQGIEAAIDAGLETYTRSIMTAIEDAQNAVYERFDVIAGILLGETGDTDMEDSARLVRKSMNKNVRLTSVEEWQMEEIQKAVDRRLGTEERIKRIREEGT